MATVATVVATAVTIPKVATTAASIDTVATCHLVIIPWQTLLYGP